MNRDFSRKLMNWDRAACCVITLVGAGWMAWLCLSSPGAPVHDEIGYYLTAKHAWQYPGWILTGWQRPVQILLYMLPSLFGLGGVRFASMLMAIATTVVVVLAAKNLGQKNLFWVTLFLWGQPWFSRLSFTGITEVPFSLVLVAGIFLALDRRQAWAGLCFGLLPLIRPEGLALTGLWVVYSLSRHQLRGMWLALAPIALYNMVYGATYGKLALESYLNLKPTDLYGQGDWLHFVEPTMNSIGVLICGLAGAGLLRWRALGWKWLAFIPYLVYFLAHSIIYRFGLFASGGYSLFILPIASGAALAAGQGIEAVLSWIGKCLPPRWQRVGLYVAAVMVAVMVTLPVAGNQPYRLKAEERAIEAASDWLKTNRPDTGRVVSTHVWFHFVFDLPWEPGENWIPKEKPTETLNEGDIVVWDFHYSERWRVNQMELRDPAGGWEEIARFGGGLVIVYEKIR